jgi:hypothetical protein
MKRRILKTKFGLLLLLGYFLACKAPSSLLQKKDSAVLLDSAQQSVVQREWSVSSANFETLQMRGSSVLQWQGKTYDVRVQIRIQQDKAIWISMQVPLMGEIGRVLITREQLSMINHMDKSYVQIPFQEAIWVGPTLRHYDAIQAVVMGQLATEWIMNDSLQIYVQKPGYWVEWTSQGTQVEWQTHEKKYLQLFRYHLPSQQQQFSAHYAYNRSSKLANFLFPSSFQWVAHWTGGNFSAKTLVQRIQIGEAIEMPFTIPATYTLMQ